MWNLINDSRYETILIALRNGPLTMKELMVEYNKVLEQEIDRLDLGKKERTDLLTKAQRAEKTLYKYLGVLEKEDLVIQAGKRVWSDQKIPEIIYSRTAKLFLYMEYDLKEEIRPQLDRALPILSKILVLLKGVPEISPEKLEEFLSYLSQTYSKMKEELFVKHAEEIAELFKDIHYDEITIILNALNVLLPILDSKLHEKEVKKYFE